MPGISTLGQFLDQISRLRTQQQQLGDLTVQISSGKKTQKLSGLGSEIMRTSRARVSVNELTIYSDNITNANRRINLMQSALGEVKEQADKILEGLRVAVQEGDFPDFESIQQLTRSVLNFIKDIMNQKDGDRYLFAGGDTSERPIDKGGLFEGALGEFVPDESDLTNPPLVASGMIGDWGDGTITTDQFIASYKAVNETTLGFSNPLTTNTAGKSIVRVSDTSEFDYTKLANDPSLREIVRILGVLQSLPPVQFAPGALNDPTATTFAEDTAPYPPAEKQESFFAVINDLTASLSVAVQDLTQDQFDLAQVQAQIKLVKDSNTDQISTFKDIIGEIEDVDTTEASAKILQLQTQLQASYQVTALVAQLTLANFLT